MSARFYRVAWIGIPARSAAPGKRGGQAVAERRGQLLLGPRSKGHVLALRAQDRGPVLLRPEPRPLLAHLVGHQEIEVLLDELAPSLHARILRGLGGEPDQHLVL